MSQSCSRNCASCAENCTERKAGKKITPENPHPLSHIKNVVAVVSGKGGVGKSLVTAMLAVAANRKGYKTAILDADVTGPSIPRAFGLKERVTGTGEGMLPVRSKTGIEVMSVNLLLERDTDPVVWRGPVIAGVVKQFWTDVIWDEVDFLFIDMPPGTGDVPLTVFQSIPVSGIVVVTTPQELVGMIVDKAVNMARMMEIPILGMVENMSYVTCPDCDRKIELFGESRADAAAVRHGIPAVAKLPLDPKLSAACDKGLIELYENTALDALVTNLEKLTK